MAQDPQTACRLLGLPRELRDIIYEYTFASTEVHITEKPQAAIRNAGLVLACKQLHAETHDLYFKHTKFYTLDMNDFRHWQSKLPSRTRGLRRHVAYFAVMGESIEEFIAGLNEDARAKLLGKWKSHRLKDEADGTGCVFEIEVVMASEVPAHRHSQELAKVLEAQKLATQLERTRDRTRMGLDP